MLSVGGDSFDGSISDKGGCDGVAKGDTVNANKSLIVGPFE